MLIHSSYRTMKMFTPIFQVADEQLLCIIKDVHLAFRELDVSFKKQVENYRDHLNVSSPNV